MAVRLSQAKPRSFRSVEELDKSDFGPVKLYPQIVGPNFSSIFIENLLKLS